MFSAGQWLRTSNSTKGVNAMATINWVPDFDQACRQAAQENKLVLLDFFSPT